MKLNKIKYYCREPIFIFSLLYLIFNLVIIYFTPFLRWDESVYVGIGKYIFSLGKSGLYESFRPSVLPLFLGFFWRIGLGSIFVYRLVVLSFSIGNLIVFYYICKNYFSEKISLLSTILLSIIPIYLIYSTKVMTGIMVSFFILLAYYCYLKEKYIWTMFFSGLAIITRLPSGMFLIIFSIMMILKEKYYKLNLKKIIEGSKLDLALLLGILPFFLLNYFFGFGIIEPLKLALEHQGNAVFAKDYLFYFQQLFKMSWIFILALPGIFYAIKDKKYSLLAFSLIPLIYFVSITNTHTRFLNMFLPFLVLISVYGLVRLFKKSRFSSIILLVLIIITIPNIFDYEKEMDFNKEVPSFFNLDDNLTIITADPVFTAYSDSKFIPIYFNVYKGRDTFVEHKDKSDLIIYYGSAYPCEFYEIPADCQLWKDDILFNLKEKELVLNESNYQFYR